MKYKSILNQGIEIEGSVDERNQYDFEHNSEAETASFLKYREELMSSEEKLLAEQILDNYREAYDDKDKLGIFDEMEIAEAYWGGDFGEPDNTDDPGSNTNIINANIESQVANMMDQAIDIEPRPYEPSDRPYIPKIRVMFDRILKANTMPRKIENHERKKSKFGTGIFKVMFNPNMLDGMGCPEIKVVNPAYIFPDPNIKDVYAIQDGQFIIETIPKSIYWAEKTFGKDRARAILPGYNPIGKSVIFKEEDGATVDLSGDEYLHIEYYTRYTDKNGESKLRLIQCSGCGIVLDDTANSADSKYNIFPEENDTYPYWFTCDMIREGMVWGKSNCSLLFGIQDLIDDLDNQLRRNARLTGNPIKLVSTGSGVEVDKLDNSAGMNIVTQDINGVKFLQPPTMPGYIIDRRNQAINSERLIVSRLSDQQAGIKQSGVSTATEALSLQQQASVGIDSKKIMLQLTLADVFMYCLELALEYWDTGMFFEEEDGKFLYFKPSDMKQIPMLKPATQSYIDRYKRMHPGQETPEYMQNGEEKRKIKVMLSITVGAGLPNSKPVVYNLILESYKAGLISKEECRKLLIEYVGLPVDTVDNAVLQLEKKQIEYNIMMLDTQMKNATMPQTQPQETGNASEADKMRADIDGSKKEIIQNPRPQTVQKMAEERNQMGG